MVFIRSMQKIDIPAVSTLLCTCYRWLGKTEGFPEEYVEFLVAKRGSVETVERDCVTELYLVACSDGTIVGMVSTRGATITRLYVDPNWHRKGVGAQLYNAAEKTIRSDGHLKLSLVALGESSVPFYQAMGMSVTGRETRRPPFPRDKKVILMERILAV